MLKKNNTIKCIINYILKKVKHQKFEKNLATILYNSQQKIFYSKNLLLNVNGRLLDDEKHDRQKFTLLPPLQKI